MYILTTLEFPTHTFNFHLLTTSVNAKYYYYWYNSVVIADSIPNVTIYLTLFWPVPKSCPKGRFHVFSPKLRMSQGSPPLPPLYHPKRVKQNNKTIHLNTVHFLNELPPESSDFSPHVFSNFKNYFEMYCFRHNCSQFLFHGNFQIFKSSSFQPY